ncbi:SurA N-terminal domain-containing protein [Gammaproteobacteria bacterium]|nr:SurA N-terminal domain-containing protein [Gammaproteobacteria bacterium]
MLDMLRTFLSGKRLIVIAILLAIPFIFFGSTSFGTTFTSYGTVNGEPVTQMDVNLASGQVTQRLKAVYGDDFTLDDLDESISLELIKNEVINQKIMFSQAKALGLSVSLKDAKQEVIQMDAFQGDQGFDQTIFESTIRANGWTPDDYFALVQESIALDRMFRAMSSLAFPIQSNMDALAAMLETSRDINFIKIDKKPLMLSQEASMEEAESFYNANPFLFLSKEQRDFSYIVLNYDAFKEQVEIPENYIEEAYADYLNDTSQLIQNRISHHMIDKGNYESEEAARSKISDDYQMIQSGQMSFEDLVSKFSEDLASKDSLGDLGLSSGDAFPPEFEEAILGLNLNETSQVIELEDSLHILKLTEVLKPTIKTKAEMEKELQDELIDAEALALMQDNFLELESLVLEGKSLNDLAEYTNSTLQVTGLQSMDKVAIDNFAAVSASELFNQDFKPNEIEIFESDNSYAFILLTQIIQPSVQPFEVVIDTAMQEVRAQKADFLINDFAENAEKILLGESTLPSQSGFSKENFKSVKRFSSLLPPEVTNEIFESALGQTVSYEADNGDRYWAQSSNQIIPSTEELGETVSRYEEFYNSLLNQQLNGFLDHTMKQGQKVRLQNFTAVN